MNAIKNMSVLMRGLLVLVLAAGMLPATQAAETVEYIHTDALGSPVAVTDANGVVIERTVYEPYGAVVGGQVKDGPGYTGHVSDSATGLSYMQQRYMDPEMGVFLSVDPITAHGQPVVNFNRHRYGNSNPYRFTDPDGRDGWDSFATGYSHGVMDAHYDQAKHPFKAGLEEQAGYAIGAAIVRGGKSHGGIRVPTVRIQKSIAPITGKAQSTKSGGVETGHAATSQRIANAEAERPDVAQVSMNQRISTVTGGEVKSSLRPDVASVRTDGKIDVTEVLSGKQEAAATASKYKNALGDKAGNIQCVSQDHC